MASTSLYWRTIAVLSVIMGIGTVVLTIEASYYARRAADDAYDRLLIGAALQIAENISVQDGVVSVDPPASAFETLALAPDDRIFYKVTDPNGKILTGYDDMPTIARRTSPAQSGPVLGDGTYLDVPVRLVMIGRFLSDAAVPGWAQVLLAQTRQARIELARDLSTKAYTILAVMMVLAFLGVMLAVRLALSPLRVIERTLQVRDPKNLAPLAIQAPHEIATLVTSINFFMGRLASRIRLMERFIADAAHQIRTPLTALASQVDLLASAGEQDREQHQRRVQERTAQLSRLTNQLLNHAMVIHRVEVVSFGKVDLCRLAGEALIHAVPLSVDRDILIGLDAPPHPVHIQGDEVSLREALSNLLHNAVKHGACSRLDIELSENDAWAVLAVIDDGPGIPQAEWEQAKLPFYSSADTGSGLGLAIVNDVVKGHGGRLEFECRGGSFAAIIYLPRHRPDMQASDKST
jgi:two-component system sensor histidine kinase TctE